MGWLPLRDVATQPLELCGSGTHPGGGVMSTPGMNAARRVIRDKLWKR
jgi:phytoene dehydrogenase-like protein